jgi:N-methylhydantoinase B
MGVALRRTAHSPNIKERRDYSCAVFDAAGQVVAQGDHMPVHLGSMPMAVAAALRESSIEPGDVIALNDPFSGGTHLPDVTLVAGVFEGGQDKVNGRKAEKNGQKRSFMRPLFYVANRAHHADIGGGSPGSMGMAADIYGEGLRIPPVHLLRGGQMNEDVLRLLLANVRGADERRADFAAQVGSLKTGAARLLEIIARAGAPEAVSYAAHLNRYSARLVRAAIKEIPDGIYEAEDALDDDGTGDEPCTLRVSVRVKGECARVDFAGSAPQVAGPVNAVEAITVSAVAYVFRCLLGADEVPASAGLMEPIEVLAPRGTIVNALPPAPVAGGNVETSQRIVDVLFKALAQALPGRIPAASQGTMNNLTIGGVDARTGREFAYYETIAGGMGARPSRDGMSGVHTHMTNSLNTPVEALEYAYPLRGKAGRRVRRIRAKGSWELKAGDRVRIETPGGGGHGKG